MPAATPHAVHVRESEPQHRRGVGLGLVVVLFVLVGAAFWHLHREDALLPPIALQAIHEALPDWHISEPVNEVVYGTRGFDTFGETFLLLAAIVGTGMISRKRERRIGFVGESLAGEREQQRTDPKPKDGGAASEASAAEAEEQGATDGPANPDSEALGTPAPERAEGMTAVVRGGVRTVAPVLAIAGIYLAAWGYSPGGGFPAGAVIAGVLLLAYVSLGYEKVERFVSPDTVEPVEMAGAFAIVALGLVGLGLDGAFGASWLPLGRTATIPGGGTLQVFSASELVEVGTGLVLAIFSLLTMRHDWARDGQPEERAKE